MPKNYSSTDNTVITSYIRSFRNKRAREKLSGRRLLVVDDIKACFVLCQQLSEH